MVEGRRMAVLNAIVSDYVRTREPVASRALAERYCLGVSPATIRNDMAALEAEGYINQPTLRPGGYPPIRATAHLWTISRPSSHLAGLSGQLSTDF